MGDGTLKDAAEATYQASIIKLQTIISTRFDVITKALSYMQGDINNLSNRVDAIDNIMAGSRTEATVKPDPQSDRYELLDELTARVANLSAEVAILSKPKPKKARKKAAPKSKE
jgi:hypothetical protein